MARAKGPRTDPVAVADRYAKDVLAGRIPAGKYTRLACRRRVDDLKRWAKTRRGAERKGAPYWFDSEAARRAVAFYGLCPHVKGEWAGSPIQLLPWETFITVELFGWRRVSDGARRYTTAYVRVAKKNGKTTWAAPLGLYLLVGDVNPKTSRPEAQSEVYSFATGQEQAKYVWQIAQHMVRQSPMLRKYITVFAYHLATVDGGVWRYLTSKATSQESINVHGGIADELHAHRTPEMWNMVLQSRGARTQALLVAITTAGFDLGGVCYQEDVYSREVLEKRIEDETRFAVIYALDQPDAAEEADTGDDWEEEANWIKANPSLGVSVSMENLREEAQRARQAPAARVEFLTKRLNMWVSAGSPWMPAELWQRQARPGLELEEFAGEMAWVGVDLASYVDLAAVLVVVQRDGVRHVFTRLYLPEAVIAEGGHAHHQRYLAWADTGAVTLTPGNVIDERHIQDDVRQICELLVAREIAVDRYHSARFAAELTEEGLPVTEFTNSVQSMSDPMKRVYADVKARELVHDGNPCMAWMMGNVEAKLDRKDNIFPRKNRDENKIDGPVALIMAYSVMLSDDGDAGEPGIIVV